MKKIVYFFIPLLSFLWACGNSYILDTETLEDVLVDIHLAEGILLQNGHDFTSQESKVDLFNSIYTKYGIDKDRLDSTLTYYSDDPTTLSDVYDNVYLRIEDISKTVNTGQYALSKNPRSKKEYQTLIQEDKDLLPFIISEFWKGEKSYNFKDKRFESFTSTIDNDSIEGDIMFRFTMKSDSLSSAQCQVHLYSKEDSTAQSFDLPLSNNGMSELKWTAKEDITGLKVVFSAEKLNANSRCELSNFRIYTLSSEKKKTTLF